MCQLTQVNHPGRKREYEDWAATGAACMESDRNYFTRRAAQEQSAATQASDESARKAHLEMAERYRQRADEGGAQA